MYRRGQNKVFISGHVAASTHCMSSLSLEAHRRCGRRRGTGGRGRGGEVYLWVGREAGTGAPYETGDAVDHHTAKVLMDRSGKLRNDSFCVFSFL